MQRRKCLMFCRILIRNAYVRHSFRLPKNQSKNYGEIDFIVECERGVACLEITGDVWNARREHLHRRKLMNTAH